jgi:hypothetical protein
MTPRKEHSKVLLEVGASVRLGDQGSEADEATRGAGARLLGRRVKSGAHVDVGGRE